MSPYRQASKLEANLGPRWGVSFRKKLYVKIARIFIDLKEKYHYARSYRNYLKRLAEWKLEMEEAHKTCKGLKPKALKPMPLRPLHWSRREYYFECVECLSVFKGVYCKNCSVK
jgi:hypothetical protein